MFDIILTLGIYSVVILLFVPLEKISKYQTAVRKYVKKLSDKV